jgi:hypothetical protein
MADSYTEVTSQSWFGRIGDSIKGIFFGLLFFAGAFFLLFWNEGRTINRYRTLKEGEGAVTPISSTSVDPSDELKLVYISGPATTDETLVDSEFGVSAPAIKIIRNVKMYQWEENKNSTTRKTLGGGSTTETTYSYQKAWADHSINSGQFKHPEGHENPSAMSFAPQTFSAHKVTLGAFTLSDSLVAKMNKREKLALDGTSLPSSLAARAKAYDGGYYIGTDSNHPIVGDSRISFEIVRPSEVSIVSQQVRDTFAPYITKAGGTIELLETGVFPQEQMFKQAESENQMWAWILRGAGLLIMWIGLVLVLKPISVLADVVPLFGTIAEAGAAFIAFVISVACSITTIAVAWFSYRPMVSYPLIALSVLCLFLFKFRRKKSFSNVGASAA